MHPLYANCNLLTITHIHPPHHPMRPPNMFDSTRAYSLYYARFSYLCTTFSRN